MSSNSNSNDSDDSNDNSNNYQRQPSVYAFADELRRVEDTWQGDGEQSPRFALLPTLVAANRVFVCGILSDVEDVGDDNEYYRAEITGPTGTFFVYAGQYQPDPKATMKRLDAPEIVAVTGKPQTFGDEDDTMVSIRPETISSIPREDYQRWVADTAMMTMQRLTMVQNGDMPGDHPVPRDAFTHGNAARRDVIDSVIDGLEDVDASIQASGDTEADADAEADAEADA